MAEKVFLNDKLIDTDKAHISATDSGFLYGAGLFETMRSYDGVVFGLKDHLDRLFSSAGALSINNPYDEEYITGAIYKVLNANKLTDARLRLTLTNGPMAESEEQRKPTLLITTTKLQPYPAEYYKKGVMVILSASRQNTFEPTCGHKTTSYFSRMITLNMAHQQRAAEALWFTTDNRLAEGCVSNVFVVKDSVIHTPRIETPVLAGIARKTVCEIASTNSIKLVEKDLYIDDVLGADEIFLTNVIMQIMPVRSVEKHTVGDGKVGVTTKRLQISFDELVESQCGKDK
ncbi:MAG: aminotransferase class IV [Planctomycetes bacterium]|nr:aminotransferase class IV [Planctomycetota bacterium]MBL7142989.1 aminotransferase class IV [Phycisphaerae bacterium]